MPLSSAQRRVLEEWMASKGISRCPACGRGEGHFGAAAYVRALLETSEEDLAEGRGVVKVLCDNCGYVMLFDAETVGIRGMWERGRNL
jgi:hypothetical protein